MYLLILSVYILIRSDRPQLKPLPAQQFPLGKRNISMSATQQFHTVDLNGSALLAAHVQLYRRCAVILSRAIAQKHAGHGCFARPESDVSLLALVATMDAVNPEVGWLEAGLLTYLHSLDHALRKADQIWWDDQWLFPIDGRYLPFEHFNLPALLRRPPTIANAIDPKIRGMLGAGFPSPSPPPSRDITKRRQALYDALLLRANAARSFLRRPDKSIPAVRPLKLPPIPPELGQPLWPNPIAPFPEPGLPFRRAFGHQFMFTLLESLREGITAYELSPRFLCRQYLYDRPREFKMPCLKEWLDYGPFSLSHGILDVAIFDHLFGAPRGELLQACLAFSRYLAAKTRWSLPYAPSWLDVEQWDAALIGAMVNDTPSLDVWRQHVPSTFDAYPPGTRTCTIALSEWLRSKRFPTELKIPKSLDKFEAGFLRALKALAACNAAECSAGVRNMLAAYPRIDYRMVRARTFPTLCLQAIALQRMAHRESLPLDVPPDPPNDPALVIAPDPTSGLLPWVPLPGIDLVTNSPNPLAWPSLYLNQPVHEVIDPPITDD